MSIELITRDDLAGFSVRRYGSYPAAWLRPGATVRIQSLTERERAAVERRMLEEQRPEHEGDGVSYRSLLIQLALVDADGRRLYGEGDLEYLDSLDAMITSRLIELVDQHCQMGAGSAARLEGAEKN